MLRSLRNSRGDHGLDHDLGATSVPSISLSPLLRSFPRLPPFTWYGAMQPSRPNTSLKIRDLALIISFNFPFLFGAFTKGPLCRYAMLHPSSSRRPDSTLLANASCSFSSNTLQHNLRRSSAQETTLLPREASNAGWDVRTINQCCTRKEPKRLL